MEGHWVDNFDKDRHRAYEDCIEDGTGNETSSGRMYSLFRQGLSMRYAAHEYVDDLKAAGLRISMSRKGNPYDNAQAESFIKTLKNDEVYLRDYKTFVDVKNRIPYFIEAVYIEKRLQG